MNEKHAYQIFRRNVLRSKDRAQRIEDLISAGVPDLNYCIGGKEGWIEIKTPTEPKRESTPLFGSNHKFSADQKNWFLAQSRARGRAFGLIVTDQRWMLIGPAIVETANEMTVHQLMINARWGCVNEYLDASQWEVLRSELMR